MIEFIQKHKERVALVGVGLLFLLCIGVGIYWQHNNQREKDPLSEAVGMRVQLKTEQPEQTEKEQSPAEPATANTTYFLKPSPEELLEQLVSMQNLNPEVIDEKFAQLPVLWPAYFFTLRQADGRTSLLLDVSEDGFGVVLESEVELTVYPRLQELTGGEKIWIGGKILAVDPAGTGTIYLKTEKLRFSAETPYFQAPQKAEK